MERIWLSSGQYVVMNPITNYDTNQSFLNIFDSLLNLISSRQSTRHHLYSLLRRFPKSTAWIRPIKQQQTTTEWEQRRDRERYGSFRRFLEGPDLETPAPKSELGGQA